MLNVIVDISHHQKYVDFNAIKLAGIIGVIHKCTQGTGFIDDKYKSRMELAKSVGLLWGAYHFGEDATVETQIDHFLTNADLDVNDLAVLDFEKYDTDQMTLQQAKEFVGRVYTHRKQFPWLYTGASFINEKLGTKIDPVLKNCYLWIAQYNNKEIKVPPTWKKWTMWQYTDGVNGNNPHEVNGIGPCDRNLFDGNLLELKKLWR